MSHEFRKRESTVESENKSTREIHTRVDALLPGISERSTLSSLEIEAGIREGEGESKYYLRFKRLFDSGDIRFLATSLLDKEAPVTPKTEEEKARRVPKRTDVHKVNEEERQEYERELEKLRNLGSDVLQLTALDLFTFERAKHDFLAGPQSNGRDYRRIFSSNSNEEVAHFMSEIAGMMKKRRDLWKDRGDHSRVSDMTAVSRYAQISSIARINLHGEFLSRYTEEEQKKIVSMHMNNIHGAQVLEESGEVVGFFRGRSEVAKRQDTGWATVKDGTSILIFKTGDGFRILADKPNVLVGEVSWVKNDRRNFSNRDAQAEVYEGELRGLPEIELVYKIGQENVSRLLGVMLLDGISNVRNRVKGKYIDGREVLEDVYARGNAILNTELIRNIEEALGA